MKLTEGYMDPTPPWWNRKGWEGRVLAGASGDLSITVERKPAVGSGITVASLLWVRWLSLCGLPQKCQPLSHTHTHTHSCRASHSLNIVFLASAALKTAFSAHFCFVARVTGLF